MIRIQNFGKLFLIFLFIMMLLFFSACQSNFAIPSIDENNETSINTNDYIMIKGNNGVIKDCTPEFSIFTEKLNIVSMSFSGNNINWSDWVDYNENYDQFNIANGLYGTEMESGIKTIFVRFKDINGVIFPQNFQEPVCCEFEYVMQELFSIRIEPCEVEVKPGGVQDFVVKGYDHFAENEVPIDGNKIEWSKPCAVGKLTPISGLKTIYTAPEIIGCWNISANYGTLGTGAKVHVLEE
jgi:hypothetical protein